MIESENKSRHADTRESIREVVIFAPRLRVVVVWRRPGVIELARTEREVPMSLEVLWHSHPRAARALIPKAVQKIPDSRRVGAASRHEGVAAGRAHSHLTIGTQKRDSSGVGGLSTHTKESQTRET